MYYKCNVFLKTTNVLYATVSGWQLRNLAADGDFMLLLRSHTLTTTVSQGDELRKISFNVRHKRNGQIGS